MWRLSSISIPTQCVSALSPVPLSSQMVLFTPVAFVADRSGWADPVFMWKTPLQGTITTDTA